MKYIYFPLFIVCLSVYTPCMAQPSIAWAKGFGSIAEDKGLSVAVDAAGNVYTTGYCSDSTDFDPGPGVYTLAPVGGGIGGDNDIFISKLDAAGNFVWAKRLGVYYGTDRGYSVKVDAAGNVYVAGVISNPLRAPNGLDILLCKLDAAGNFIWYKQYGGSGSEEASSIAIDALGNVYITGYYSYTVDFDPGPAVYNLTAAGYYDGYVSKFDSSGNFIWVKSIGGDNYDAAHNIAVDNFGHLYVMGSFNGTADFDPGPATYNVAAIGNDNTYIVKLDTSGNFIAAGFLQNIDLYNQGSDVLTTDAAGNLYICGNFHYTVDFDLGPDIHSLTAIGAGDAFIVKMNATGAFVWAKNFGSTTSQGAALASSVSVDAAGNVYTTGSFSGVGDFDPGPANYNLTAAGNYDIFVSKLDSSGNFVWATNVGGNSTYTFYTTASDVGYSIAVSAAGNVYVTGNFADTVHFIPGVDDIISHGNIDVVVFKLGQNAMPLTLISFAAKAVSNHLVNLQWKTAQEENTAKFIVERSADQKTFSAIGTVAAAGNSSFAKTYSLNDAEPLKGTNFYRLKMVDKDGSFTYSKVMAVRFAGENSFNIYPNPATSFVQLQFNKQLSGKVEIYVTDAEGRVVMKNTAEGSDKMIIQTGKLASGNYVIKVINGNDTYAQKMLVK